MEIPSKYQPQETESKWYEYWLKNRYFNSVPDDREPYAVVIPPPNVTGVLHMGHMLNNSIQDILVRRARMQGFNACWVPGTDHASIATEAKVVRKLREQGIKKSDLSRNEFLKHAYAWKDEYGGVILKQLQKLGASCDWDRTSFTMDPKYSESVVDTFIKLYQEGFIYRGERMINWDPAAKTALSDEEVIFKEVDSHLYHVRYKIVGSDDYLTIATTRPETILGDTAICVNPNDERHKNLHGKRVIVPIVGREIPIIQDEYVDMEFGTGCLKVTPAHDPNDFVLGEKHNLEVINILNADGTMSPDAKFYIGEDRFDVRKQIAKDLDAAGHLVEKEPYKNKVGFSERTDVVIEPRLSQQWWVKMEDLAGPALEVVENGEIQFHPKKFVNTYRHWLTNIKDWCISRQLWWGHQIPAFYYGEEEGEFVVAKTAEEALPLAKDKSGNQSLSIEDLKQDEDVMDTWFSSWLWPISVFDGLYESEEVDYYNPTNDLVTGPDIIFFWVARMIMASKYYRNEVPFKNVYFTGIVRDQQGRKMSKSLGNSPDPLELIKEYGADGVRVGLLLTAPAGNDLPFDVKLCEQGRNFANKIWNAFRLIRSFETEDKPMSESAQVAHKWMEARLNQVIGDIDKSFAQFRISEALMSAYKLIWNDYCSWYLEMIKPPYGEKIDSKSREKAIDILETLLRILHPFMPFLSEEVWQHLEKRQDGESICVASWPEAKEYDQNILDEFEKSSEIITQVRNIRLKNQISFKEKLVLSVLSDSFDSSFHGAIKHLCGLTEIEFISEKADQSFSFIVDGKEYFIPFGDSVDTEEEKSKLIEEIEYAKGFLNSVQKKLSNERFVNNAPAQVVEIEKKKQADAENKLKMLEDKLKSLN